MIAVLSYFPPVKFALTYLGCLNWYMSMQCVHWLNVILQRSSGPGGASYFVEPAVVGPTNSPHCPLRLVELSAVFCMRRGCSFQYYHCKALSSLDSQDLCIILGLTRAKSCWLIWFWFPLVTLHSCQGCIETYLKAIVLQLQILLNRARFKNSGKTTSLAISLPTTSVMQLKIW